jgi:hypothetical protein
MPRQTVEIYASFATPAEAENARGALLAAGIPPDSIVLQHGVLPEPREREARFFWRVLVIIVLWSVAGAIPGAMFGWLLAETIGPEGTAGLIVQVVSWMIVGHLIGGMLAGYFVLADRSQREMPPDRPVSLLTVRELSRADVKELRRIIRSHEPTAFREARSPA